MKKINKKGWPTPDKSMLQTDGQTTGRTDSPAEPRIQLRKFRGEIML